MDSRFPHGDPNGHADPSGAATAGQARAGRILDAGLIRQSEDAKFKVTVGDFLLTNDKLAVYIEAEGASDGYMPFGGEILAISPVGSDGKAVPISEYGETLVAFSRQAVKPDKVTVLNDGSDGKEAVVRVSGKLTNIPFLDTFAGILTDEFDFPAALDYVLAPHAEVVTLRLSLMNPTAQPSDLSNSQNIGFFHTMRNDVFTPGSGFGGPGGDRALVAFEPHRTDGAGFAWRLKGLPFSFLIDVSGFDAWRGSGLQVASCETKTVDYAELIAGGATIDDVLATVRRVDGDTSFRTITGTVKTPAGVGVGGALVHLVAADGKTYLSRTRAASDGGFSLHAPAAATQLYATGPGYPTSVMTPLDAGATSASLVLGATGTIVVTAKDTGSNEALPVRIQVISATAVTAPPSSFGVLPEINGRLHLEFAHTGTATFQVPPGSHEVIVSRGFEWEVERRTVDVLTDQTTHVDVSLLHSVESTGVMCADFHIHSHYSADAPDAVELKVRSAIADGLEIPVSSEHEWVIDFQPIIQKLGLTKWAYGFPSEEFTTFQWGHFGVVPLNPNPAKLNNGAVDWVGRKPPEVFHTISQLDENPVLIINHPRSQGNFGAYFNATNLSRTTGVGDPDLWSSEFEAIEVFNDSDFESNRDSTVADWFAFLQLGRKMWAVGNSDSHHVRTSPVGYPRTCFQLGTDDPTKLTANIVRDVLRKGAAVVSGGLMMTVVGPGGIGPGGTIATAGAQDFQVKVQAPSWLSAATLEVIVDGDTVQTLQLQEQAGPGPNHVYDAMVTVNGLKTQAQHWVVFHASSTADLSPLSPGRKPFAVSNPVFF